MVALEPEVTRALALRAIGGALLRLKWLAAATRFEIALRRHDRALKYAHKYGYNPSQPRDAIGRWTDSGGGQGVRLAGGGRIGGGGLRGGFGSGSFPGSTNGQQVQLYMSIARLQRATAQVRQFEPNWKPSVQSVTTLGGIEGEIRDTEARAEQAEARFYRLQRGLDPNGRSSADTAQPELFDGEPWISAYRNIHNTSDLFGRPTWRYDSGTVAVSQINGRVYYGVNSTAPGYTNEDFREASIVRDFLIQKYPEELATDNIGRIPNDSVFHAESTVLLRAARENNGTLEGLNIEVRTDRKLCSSCEIMLPRIGIEVGNPRVTYIDNIGRAQTMRDGKWE